MGAGLLPLKIKSMSLQNISLSSSLLKQSSGIRSHEIALFVERFLIDHAIASKRVFESIKLYSCFGIERSHPNSC
jgi:hypothetical protein